MSGCFLGAVVNVDSVTRPFVSGSGVVGVFVLCSRTPRPPAQGTSRIFSLAKCVFPAAFEASLGFKEPLSEP